MDLKEYHLKHGIYDNSYETVPATGTMDLKDYPDLVKIGKVDVSYKTLPASSNLTAAKNMIKAGFDPRLASYAVEVSGFGPSNGHVCAPVETDLPFEAYRKEVFVHEGGEYYTGWHIDYEDWDGHGFRVLIPVTKPTYLVFRRDTDRFYKLEVGNAYFVNTAILHRGMAFGSGERVFIHAALADDALILDGEEVQTIEPFGKDVEVHEFWES